MNGDMTMINIYYRDIIEENHVWKRSDDKVKSFVFSDEAREFYRNLQESNAEIIAVGGFMDEDELKYIRGEI